MKIGHMFLLVIAIALVATPAHAQRGGVIEEKPAVAVQEKGDPVQSWVQVLIGRIDAKNEVVRTSVERALVAVGKPALPALQAVSKGKNAKKAAAAKKVIATIENPRRRGQFGGRRDPLAGIKLTGDQKAKVDKALKAHQDAQRQMMEDMRNGDMGREEWREARQELNAKRDKELKAVLSEEQFKKFKENSQRRRGGGRGGRRGRGSDG